MIKVYQEGRPMREVERFEVTMPFYKIVAADGQHNLMHYKKGLNVDLIPFHPHEQCCAGGMYFAYEYILEFLDYGPYIRKVTIPDGASVYIEDRKIKADKFILGERVKIDCAVILRLLKEGARFPGCDQEGIIFHHTLKERNLELLDQFPDLVYWNWEKILKTGDARFISKALRHLRPKYANAIYRRSLTCEAPVQRVVRRWFNDNNK